MGSDLKTWVSDKLMSLLGYSQPTVVKYVIGLSKQASSPSEFVSKLVNIGLSSSSETHAFADEIYAKIPRKAGGLNLYQKQERDAAMLVRKQKTYTLLDADDEENDVGGGGNNSTAKTSQTRKADHHKKRFRKKTENPEDEDEDEEA